MEKRIFICQQCGAELCADEVDGMLGHAVPDFDNAGDVYGCNQCGPCEVVPDRAIAYIAALEQQLAAAQERTMAIRIIFDGPPGPDAGQFVEVETDTGESISIGEWIDRKDGYWALRIAKLPAPPEQED